MATAQTIINSALRKLGVLGIGETPAADESGDCLVALNQLLETWRNERLMAYVIDTQQKAISGGASSITIGAGGSWAIERPVKLESATWTEGIRVVPVDVSMTQEEFASLNPMGLVGFPRVAYYQADYPLATLKWWPTPVNAGTLTIGVRNPLLAFAALSTTVSLPPGYERALSLNLAMELAPEYQLSPSTIVAEGALESKAVIKRVNTSVPVLKMSPGLPMAGGHYNILSDR